jgi:hypothetical protein
MASITRSQPVNATPNLTTIPGNYRSSDTGKVEPKPTQFGNDLRTVRYARYPVYRFP